MESLFFELKKLLQEQNEIIIDLITSAREHTHALGRSNVKEMMAAVNKLEVLSNRLTNTDKEREQLISDFAQDLKIDSGLSLNELLIHCQDTELFQRIRELAEDIRNNINELTDINKINKTLVKRGLLFTEQLKDIIQPKVGCAYGESGKLQGQKKSISMINKTI